MEPSTRRQIKDIQFQAERLIKGRPSIDEIKEFNQYNEELKIYLLNHLKDPDLLERVNQIPGILEESIEQIAIKNVFFSFLMFIAPSLINYLEDRQRIENAKENILEARGKYASIEFLERNYR